MTEMYLVDEDGDKYEMEQLSIPMPNMIFVVFRETGTRAIVRDGRTSVVSMGEVVSVWSSLEAAANEVNAIITEIGEEEYANMEDSFVVNIFEVRK